MMIVLTRLWQDQRVVRNIALHPHLQDIDSIFTNDLLYALLDGDEVLAYAVVRREKHLDRLKSLFTFPEHRGHGYATLVVRAVLHDAHQKLLLTCKENMVPFYKRLGFRFPEKTPFLIRLRLFLCNGFLSAIYPHHWYAMTYMPKHKNGTLSERPKLRRLARRRSWSR